MPRLPLTDLHDDSFYAALGNRPEILEAWGRLDLALLNDESSTLPTSLKEEVRRSLSQQVGCEFCASIGGRPASEHPDPKESLAVAFADQVVRDHRSIDDATFDVLREEFDDEQILELLTWICFKLGSNVLGSLLKLEPASEAQTRDYAVLLQGATS